MHIHALSHSLSRIYALFLFAYGISKQASLLFSIFLSTSFMFLHLFHFSFKVLSEKGVNTEQERDNWINVSWETSPLHCQNITSGMFFCDVIWENPAYGAANSVFLGQTFPYVYIHILFSKCAEWEKSVVCRCSCMTKSQGSDQTPRVLRGVWSKPALFVLHKLSFPRWRHISILKSNTSTAEAMTACAIVCLRSF